MKDRINLFLAEDDQDDQFLFKTAISELKVLDYHIECFYNGREILDYLFKPGDCEILPDIIVLDLNMPAVDGLSVLKKIKASEKLRDIPIFILSTSNHEDHKLICRELGCSEFYVKPVKLNELKKIAQKILLQVAVV